jgi:hypothetical protein
MATKPPHRTGINGKVSSATRLEDEVLASLGVRILHCWQVRPLRASLCRVGEKGVLVPLGFKLIL